MTEEQIALAKRAVACKGWRWMGGMLAVTGPAQQSVRLVGSNVSQMAFGLTGEALPVLDDPATLGCLLALVREAHAVPFLQVSVKISREHGYQFDCHPHHRGQWVDSEADALVAALEHAC
jgi:hypothetical protein